MIGGVLLALLILLVIGIAIIFDQRKKQNYKPTKEKGTKPHFYFTQKYHIFAKTMLMPLPCKFRNG